MRFALLAILSLLAPLTCRAEPMAYSCQFAGPPVKAGARDARMDRVVLDAPKKRVELQVANTIGTAEKIDWTFRDGAVEKSDRLAIVRTGDDFLAVGLRAGEANMLSYKDGILRWQTFTPSGEKADETVYRCQR